MERSALIRELSAIVGPPHVVYRPEDLLVYEYDAAFDRAVPDLVVLPATADEVARVVKVARRVGMPVVPRGAGTGLSGGSVPIEGGIAVVLSRMRAILEIDVPNRLAITEPGVVNVELSNAVARYGLYYAPDPSSQKACTLGGNVAENSGGPHCLARGVTTNHVLGVEVVLPSGDLVSLGGKTPTPPGYDLLGLMVGSEGTLGIVTKIVVRLLPLAEATKTFLAIFDSVDAASGAVSAIIGRGIIPAALEMMDRLVLRAVEPAVHAGYPPDAEAVLLVEIEGLREALAEQSAAVEQVCRAHGAREIRVAETDRERELLWAGRKGAIGALGRLAPNYLIQDGVVPRTKLPEVLRGVAAIAARYDLPIANVFHAGDGNLHPLVLFDARRPGELERVVQASEDILRLCVAAGGPLSGEHGVGIAKRAYMPWIFTAADLAAMARVKSAFDPAGLFNPGKIFPPNFRADSPPPPVPTEDRRGPARPSPSPRQEEPAPELCPERSEQDSEGWSPLPPFPPREEPAQSRSSEQSEEAARGGEGIGSLITAIADIVGADGLASSSDLPGYAVDGVVPGAAAFPATPAALAALLALCDRERLAVAPRGGGTKTGLGGIPRALDLVLGTARLDRVLQYEPADLTVTVEAGITLGALQEFLAKQSQFLPLDPPLSARATIGGVLAADASGPRRLAYGTARDLLLGVEVVLANGVAVKGGGRVVKNATGYDLSKLFLGSLGTLGVIVAATFKVSPLPPTRATLLLAFPDLQRAAAAGPIVAAPPLEPLALELLGAPAVERLPLPVDLALPAGAGLLAIEFAGGNAAVARQLADATQRGREQAACDVVALTEAPLQDGFWRALRDIGRADSVAPLIARLGLLPTQLPDAIAAVLALAASALDLTPVARAGGSVLYVYGWPSSGAEADPAALLGALVALQALAVRLGGTLIVEACPTAVKRSFPVWGPPRPDFPVLQRLKQHFDPQALLNPGRFVGGI